MDQGGWIRAGSTFMLCAAGLTLCASHMRASADFRPSRSGKAQTPNPIRLPTLVMEDTSAVGLDDGEEPPPPSPEEDTPGVARSLPPMRPFFFDGDVRNLPGPSVSSEGLSASELIPIPQRTLPDAVEPTSTFLNEGAPPHVPMPFEVASAPNPTANFEGMGNVSYGGNAVPPDVAGAVGVNYFVQFLNSATSGGGTVGIYNKSDGSLAAQFYYATLFSAVPTGTNCDNSHSDPQVVYDSVADRFILVDITLTAPYSFCVAVARTSNPVTGGWNLYVAPAGSSLPDYPKAGIWPDGLYIGAQANSALAAVLNKDEMEAGQPAHIQTIAFPSVLVGSVETVVRPDPSTFHFQTGTPPAGAPNYFGTIYSVGAGASAQVFRLWKFHVDWNNAANSTLTGPTDITLSPWTVEGLTVSSTANPLDTLREHTTNALKYTNIGGVESLWAVHGVAAPGAATIGAEDWIQITDPGGTPTKTQQSTFVPDLSISRIQGCVGVDKLGDMLIAYTATSSTINPGIRYSGRLFNDALNTLPQTENVLVNGGGGFSATCGGTCTRWGDYSTMSLDPDGCTLWFTAEYIQATGPNWNTRIGSVTLPGCTVTYGNLQGTVTDSSNGNPLSGATVNITGGRSASTTTNAAGFYQFSDLYTTTYTVTATFPGYDTASASATVTSGNTTISNIALAPNNSGCFTDTNQPDFQAGTTTNVDLMTAPGDVVLSHTGGQNTDQQNQTFSSSGFAITATTWGAQTFTPSVSGALTRLDVYLFCSTCTSGTPPITVDIRNTSGGSPGPGLLASTTIPGFTNGAGAWYTATFSFPPSVTAGTLYSYVLRLTSNRSDGGSYAYSVSAASTGGPYGGGQRYSSTNSGGAWTANSTRDLGFVEYVTTPVIYVASGHFTSSVRDSNPTATETPHWTSLAWTSTVSAQTSVLLRAATSNSASGPFTFVGPDGGTGTYFASSPVSLSGSVFAGRYLKYRIYLTTSNTAFTPTVSDVTVCYDNTCNGLANGTSCNDLNPCTSNDVCTNGTCAGAYSCDDGNLCTNDACNPAIGCTHTNNSNPCNDGNACTMNDTCAGGTCGGAPISCDDGNVCTTDSCNPATGCTHTNNTNPCNDGNACTTNDTCAGGTCGGTPISCDDSNVCTTDGCNSAMGCTHTNNTNPCDDGSACTTNDTCSSGLCGGGAVNCDDGNPCTADGCNPTSGCTHTNNSVACDDGDVCTNGDVCSGGICSGTPISCDDSNACTDDLCDPSTGCYHVNNTGPCDDHHGCTINDVCAAGACVGTPVPGCRECVQTSDCNDDNVCTNDVCQGGVCIYTNNSLPCNDGDACTTNDECLGGSCLGGPALNCDDSNVCTDDSCNPASGCIYINNANSCDDADACTTNDTCSGGSCVGGAPPNCDDANDCTDDSCDPATGCVYVNNIDPCDDGNACTINDKCSDGTCVGGTALVCNDGNGCTDDFCVPTSGCVYINNSSPCDDADACTINDTCMNGGCVSGPPLDCNDQNVCTDDSCISASGCRHVNNFAPCDDENACTTNDTCGGGSCLGGPPPDCGDGNVCTDDLCDSGFGCYHVNNTHACDDGHACTTNDTCSHGVCAGSAVPNCRECSQNSECNDGTLCTTDTCQGGRCIFSPNSNPCDDGNACTINDTCSNGSCIGAPADCNDNNPCTDDACDMSLGCRHVNNSNPCGDANACTTHDTCVGGTCQGTAINCNDGNVCTDDSCNPVSGCRYVNNTAPCDRDGDPCTMDQCDGNGKCTFVQLICDNPTTPIADPAGIEKVRYISFSVTTAAAAEAGETALQVKLVSLMHPSPPNLPQFPAPNFTSFEGQFRYVGSPTNCTETESPYTIFKCAPLQCAPVYIDWSAALGSSVLHVSGRDLVSSSTYEVRQLAAMCQGSEPGCTAASSPLTINTQRWGDIVAPFQIRGNVPLTQPNINDIVACVDKFRSFPSAPIVARADVNPSSPNGVVNILDVTSIADGFKGSPYPFAGAQGPQTCP